MKSLFLAIFVLSLAAEKDIFWFPPLRALQAPTFDYDFYLLALSWPGSTCQLNKCTNTDINKGSWNLHGLWPTSGETSPEDCQDLRIQEKSLNQNLRKDLYNFWNGLYSPSWVFVRHEITKHGTCWINKIPKGQTDIRVVDILNTINPRNIYSRYDAYVGLAVYLSKKMDLFNLLRKNGVSPDDSKPYDIQKILTVINEKWRRTSAVIPVCTRDTLSGRTYLQELRICLDLNYNVMNCDANKVRRSANYCGRVGVYLPLVRTSQARVNASY